MIRRRIVAAVSAVVLVILGVGITGGVVAFSHTEYGREKIRTLLMAELRHVIHGRIYIGHISGSLLTNVSVDSLEVIDPDGLLFFASGPLTARYDPRDLFDRRILIQQISVQHPVIYLIQHRSGVWNVDRVFHSSSALHAPGRPRALGDYIVLDSVDVHGGFVRYTSPWDPNAGLRPAQRDSETRDALRDTAQEVESWHEGLMHSLTFHGVNLRGPYVRIADPDSVGLGIVLDHMDVDISDPPLRFRSARGVVHIVGDTAFANLAEIDMPGSHAHGGGKIWWGNHPLAYALHFVGDSVSLADVAWVYPTLPTTGGGHTLIDIMSHTNPHIVDYRLTNMDVRTTQSHLLGNMTFTVGEPILAVHDVALQADPLDLEFIKTLGGGKPFPYPWRGRFTGFARGPGGPLSTFQVDTIDLTMHDANVPDAVSHAAGSGELNIVDPSETIFHHFHLTLHQLDLRTPEFVNRELGHLQGTLLGSAVLDSTWDDVRITKADFTHEDGGGIPSHVTGTAHITLGDTATRFDLDAEASPVSFTTIAQSYPEIPLRGSFTGPFSMHGTLGQLDVSTTLTSDAGTFAFDGSGNFYGPVYSADGTLTLRHADLRRMTDNAKLPFTDLSGRFEGALQGDSLPTMAGRALVSFDSSIINGVTIEQATAPITLSAGRLHFDSLRIAAAIGVIRSPNGGGIGLTPEVSDSLMLSLVMDSLGALRPYLVVDTTLPDTLAGLARVDATIKGNVDALTVAGTVVGDELRTGETRVRTLNGTFHITDWPHHPEAMAQLALNNVAFGRGGMIDSIRTTVSTAPNEVSVDSFALYLPRNVWRLHDPAHAHLDSIGLKVAPFAIRDTDGGWVTMGGTLPNVGHGDALITLEGDSLSVADFGVLAQGQPHWQGWASFKSVISGPRESPHMRVDGALNDVQVGAVHLEQVRVVGAYEARRLQLIGNLFVHGDTAVQAAVSVPVDLSLVPVRQRILDDTLRGSVHTDSTDFGVLATVIPSLSNPKGQLAINVNINGTVRHPILNGDIHLTDAEAGFSGLGVRFVKMGADLHLAGDSLAIRNVSGTSISQDRQGHANLSGWMTFADITDPHFDVTFNASNFHVMDRPRLADLEITVPTRNPIHLVGQETHSRLTGAVQVVRGSIFIPDLTQKHVINLDDPEFFNLVDTSLEVNRELIPIAPPRLVQGLTLDRVQITLGQDVWLKSSEAHINLSTSEGPLVLTTTSTGERNAQKALALTGTLVAERGDYRLNLGIVQRNFLVDQPGTLRFTGEPELNPDLDITAVHTVRQPQSNSADVTPELSIRVHLGGTLAHPTVSLSSADSLQQLSQADLISYLVTGQQSFDVANGTNTSTLTSVFLPTLGSALGSQLSGGLLDYLQVQTGGYSQFAPTATQGTILGTLSASRIGAGKQIGDRTFVSADLGVCQLAGGGGATTPTFTDQIGVRVEHQLTSHFSIAGASEPATTALYCGNAISRSFVATPRQWGLDLFRTWQF